MQGFKPGGSRSGRRVADAVSHTEALIRPDTEIVDYRNGGPRMTAESTPLESGFFSVDDVRVFDK